MRASIVLLLCVLLGACDEPGASSPVRVDVLDPAAARDEVLDLVKEGGAQGVLRFGASLRNPAASAQCGVGMRRLWPRVERLRDAELPKGVAITDLFACVNCDPSVDPSLLACMRARDAAERNEAR